MKVGTLKEIMTHEYRVGMTPANVTAYISSGHKVFVETKAGLGAGFSDEEYIAAGAEILPNARQVYETCDMIIKVKQPLEEEYAYLRDGLILYTYLHLAANKTLTEVLMRSGVSAVAFETITDKAGTQPCLRPMSEVAGRLSVQEGAKYLERHSGGRGILLGGATGVERGNVLIIGGGVAGTYAAKVAVGMGAQVTVLDISLERLAYLEDIFGASITTLYSSEANIEKCIKDADLVIGAVLVPGRSAPKLIKKEHIAMMKKGTVIVDIAIDQGGCVETSHVTTHDDPTFVLDGIIHYCVGNMPGAVPRTSTIALSNATLPYGLKIANLGLEEACRRDAGLANGVNIYKGRCVNANVASSLMIEYSELAKVFWKV